MTRWFAVRCCCEGSKVLGFMLLTDDVGPQVVVTSRLNRELRPLICDDVMPSANVERHVVEIRTYGRELAIYSEDRPIEFWRGLQGFVEAVQP
jgi:hypothetical protein